MYVVVVWFFFQGYKVPINFSTFRIRTNPYGWPCIYYIYVVVTVGWQPLHVTKKTVCIFFFLKFKCLTTLFSFCRSFFSSNCSIIFFGGKRVAVHRWRWWWWFFKIYLLFLFFLFFERGRRAEEGVLKQLCIYRDVCFVWMFCMCVSKKCDIYGSSLFFFYFGRVREGM